MTQLRRQTGKTGEDLACDFLEKLNYVIIERNFYSRLGEIDIVARSGEYLIFCEVKTRSENQGLHPTASITAKKIKKMRQLGLLYMQKKHLHQLQPRFDVIAIQLSPHQSPQIEHFINAL